MQAKTPVNATLISLQQITLAQKINKISTTLCTLNRYCKFDQNSAVADLGVNSEIILWPYDCISTP